MGRFGGKNRREVSMSVQNTATYIFGSTQAEQQRLVAQAEDLKHHAHYLLDQVGIQPGWNAIDVGCGPIGILDLLSERVGRKGRVTGLEYVSRFAEMAKVEIVKRGLANVDVLEDDILSCGLPKNSFDLVHERLVLINVPNPESLLDEMVALARPGGTVALEEVDNASWFCLPNHPSWDILLKTYHSAFLAGGGDAFFGRRLPRLLRSARLEDVRYKVHAAIVDLCGHRRKHLVGLLDSLHDKVISLGLLTERELTEHKKSLARHLDDPDTIVVDKLLVQAWGRKP
jgi:ubiquinone/menaquinone biosynthesis C-methylase UbiE